MHVFLQPLGAVAFLGAAVILALYFLRRKHVDIPVSSTLLWRGVLEDVSAASPFQRLRKRPLLILRLLIAILLALALMRPALPGEIAGETVMIFDCSASMQARENGKSRLEAAVEQANDRLSTLAPDAPLTILTAGRETKQLLSRSTDRSLARQALASIRADNTGADLTGALSLARAMNAELGDVQIIVYSDSYIPPQSVTAGNSPRGLDNRAVLSLSGSGSAAVARVANYGGETVITAECYADGALCDARQITAAEGETMSLRFAVPEGAAVLSVHLTEKDAIEMDDTAYFVRREASETLAALAGNNTFLEHALTLRDDVRLIRTTEAEWSDISGVKLYVRDGDTVTFSTSAGLPPVTLGDTKTAEHALTLTGQSGAEELTCYLSLSQTALRQYRPLSGGTAFLQSGEDIVGAFGEDWVMLGFDLHDSNLPLKYDFPLLIQNILAYLVPSDEGLTDGVCGAVLTIRSQGTVFTPDGRRVNIPESGLFTDTEQAGLYILRTEDGREMPFALHMEYAESDVRQVAPSTEDGQSGSRTGRREITPWLLLAALLLILLEGGLSRRAGTY